MSRHATIWLIFLLGALLLPAGCAGAGGEVTASLGQEISLSIGETALIEGEELRLKFTEVVGDSRCPKDIYCFWQGEVSCGVEVTYSGDRYQMVLTQPGLTAEPSVKTFQQYHLTFSVDPYPESGKEIRQKDYRLNLTVDKVSLSGGILVTFDVNGETYSVFTTNEETITRVFAVQRGESQATIPSGRLIRGGVFYNEPWSWHIDPEDVHMAEFTIELCDGIPSHVEENLDYWVDTVQRFCPWNARIVSIEDFR